MLIFFSQSRLAQCAYFVGDGLLFFFQAFDPLDESTKLIACDAVSIRHGLLLDTGN